MLSLFLVGCKDTQITGGAVAIQEETTLCTDSDGGIDRNIKGIISVGDEDFADSCIAGVLVEYYCDGDKAVNQNIRCANECSNGKCT